MRIIGILVKILTLPGTLLYAFWEHLICRIYRCPVEDGRYLRMNEMCGHVEHEQMESTVQRFFLAFFPFFFNVALGTVIVLPASMAVVTLGEYNIASLLLLWVGISLLVNVFPSVEDALFLWDAIYTRNGGIHIVGKILLAPFAAIVYAGAYLSQWGLTLLTGGAVRIFLPMVFWPFV